MQEVLLKSGQSEEPLNESSGPQHQLHIELCEGIYQNINSKTPLPEILINITTKLAYAEILKNSKWF